MNNPSLNSNKSQKKNLKCFHCNKKLPLIHFNCRCQQTFCIQHLNPHSHNCPFDVKSAKQIEIIKNNPKLSSKVVKI